MTRAIISAAILSVSLTACGGDQIAGPDGLHPMDNGALTETTELWSFGPQNIWVAGQIEERLGTPTLESGAEAAGPQMKGTHGSLRHWNGVNWTDIGLPEQTTQLDDAWGTPAGEVWSVATFDSGESAILHFDGSDWQVEHVTENTLVAIFGSSLDNLWVIGDAIDDAMPVVLRRNQNGWERIKDGVLAGDTLRRGYCASERDTWLFGDAAAYYFDGTGWTVEEDLANLVDIGGVSNNAVITDGFTLRVTEDGREFFEAAYDGLGCNEIDGYCAELITAVFSTSARDIWVAGGRTLESGCWVSECHEVEGVLAHFDGETWSIESLGVGVGVTDIFGDASGQVWLTSADGTEIWAVR